MTEDITLPEGQVTIILHDNRCWTSPKVTQHKQRAFPLFSTPSQTLQLVTLTKIYSAIKHSTRGLCYAKFPPQKRLSTKLLLICTMTGDTQVQQHTPGCLPHIKHMLAAAPQRPHALLLSITSRGNS